MAKYIAVSPQNLAALAEEARVFAAQKNWSRGTAKAAFGFALLSYFMEDANERGGDPAELMREAIGEIVKARKHFVIRRQN